MSRVIALLCADLERFGFDPRALADELTEHVDGVEVVPGLCDHADRATRAVARLDGGRLVLGLCARGDHDELRSRLRARGADPLGVEQVALGVLAGGTDGEARALTVLAGAAARLRAYPGTRADGMRLRLAEGPVSRRALFTLPPVGCDPVAFVDGGACVGTSRCGRCAPACPFGAVNVDGMRPEIDKGRCVACGRCVVACPTDAIGLAGMSRSEQEARLGRLLAEPGPGLVAVCERAWSALDDLGDTGGWLPVQVPCLSALSAGWLLQALTAGAPAVTLVGCGSSCRAEAADEISRMVEYCREALVAVGEDPDRIRLGGSHDRPSVEPLPGPPPRAVEGPMVLGEPGATADALIRLGGAPETEVRVEHPASPLGLVTAVPGACTVCGACGEGCPTGALTIDRDGEHEVLRFDHRRCVGCGACIGVCPENALTLRMETDLAALVAGPVVLAETATVHCESCGRPVAPAAMLNRLARVLADSPEILDIVGRRCADCRTGARVGPPIG